MRPAYPMETPETPKMKSHKDWIVICLPILAVFVVLGCLLFINTGIAEPESPTASTRTSIGSICNAVRVFDMHVGRLPDSIDDLTNPINDRTPLLKKEGLVDAWGHAFLYTRQGQTFEVRSAGPDGQMGTEDDQTN